MTSSLTSMLKKNCEIFPVVSERKKRNIEHFSWNVDWKNLDKLYVENIVHFTPETKPMDPLYLVKHMKGIFRLCTKND